MLSVFSGWSKRARGASKDAGPQTIFMFIPPFPQGCNDRDQAFPKIGEMVFDFEGNLRVDRLPYQFVLFQLLQLHIEYPAGCVGDLAL